MSKNLNIENIAEDLNCFINNREYDLATAEYDIFEGGSQSVRYFEKDGKTVGSGGTENSEVRARAQAAARNLVLEATQLSGQQAWGFIFRMTPPGKVSVKFSYEMPAWLLDTDEDSGIPKSFKRDASADEEQSALEWLRKVTADQVASWNLSHETRWDLDASNGKVAWHFDGAVSKVASVQFIGTQRPGGSFRWAWANASIPAPYRSTAELLRKWGADRNLAEFLADDVQVDELRVWCWTALGAQLAGAEGAYRVNSNGLWIYFVFSNLRAEPTNHPRSSPFSL